MTDNSSKSGLRNTWETAAPGWAKWEQAFSANLDVATDMLIDMAGIQPGMRVLDLACGAGSQTIQSAKRVGPAGRVVASDISATMLDHVRQNAAKAGLKNIETIECAADELDQAPLVFDAAICRLGLMLFPSPRAALDAVIRVLKPGARFAALVVTTPANNPFLARPMAILLAHAKKSPPGPGQPGLFALGGDKVLETLMQDSGFADVQTRTIKVSFSLPSASDAVEMMQQAFGAYRAVVAELSEVEKSKAWEEVYECLKPFETAHGFKTDLELIIGAGFKAS